MEANDGINPNGTRSIPLPDQLFYTKKIDTGKNSCKWDIVLLQEAIKQVPYSLRQTYTMTHQELGVPRSTVYWMVKRGHFINHTATVKPTLGEVHKVGRVMYAIDHIDPTTVNNIMRFKEDYDVVYVDEKWFNITQIAMRCILAPGEKGPQRKTRHKGYVEKIMFLCAQARPREIRGRGWWDGKIAMIPIGDVEYQQRSTVARQAGQRRWKNKAVTLPVYRQLLLEVVDAIISKWPNSDWGFHPKIRIQHNGAPGHIDGMDEGWLEGLVQLGVADKIELFQQPSQSPDLNICDLGLFNAIQLVYQKEAPRDSFDIIDCVQKAYEEYPVNKINRLWLHISSRCHEQNL